jgi:hypothetical protein
MLFTNDKQRRDAQRVREQVQDVDPELKHLQGSALQVISIGYGGLSG